MIFNFDFSIILLSWNGMKYIDGCLQSIKRQTHPSFEVIIVDNNSTDGTADFIEGKKDPEIKFYRMPTNLGFAKGMNFGIQKAIGKYLLILNQDVVLDDNFLTNSFVELEHDSNLAVISGIEKKWKNGIITNDIVTWGGYSLKRRIQGFSNLYRDVSWRKRAVFGVHGSFFCIRKQTTDDLFYKMGYVYDPKFETGWEDLDLWFRINTFGWKIRYSDKLIAWHAGSGSANENQRLIDKPLNYQARIFRNRYYLMIKNINLGLFLALFPYILAAELAIIPYYLVVSPKSLRAICIGLQAVVVNLPSLLSDRRKTNKYRIRSTKEMLKYFRCF